MLTSTQTKYRKKPHPRPRVKNTSKDKEEMKACLFVLLAVIGMEIFNYTIYALRFVYHVIS